MRLNPKHLAFIDYYCNPSSDTYANATKAYLKAGYQDNKGTDASACKLLAKPDIQKAIKEANDKYKAKRDEKAEFTEAFVRQQMLNILESCKDDEGKVVDRTNANAIVRTMGQHKAMLTDKIQSETVDTPELTDDEKWLIDSLAKDYNKKASELGLKIG